MSKRTFFQSILSAKSNPGTPQKFFALVEPNPDWIQNMPHQFLGEAEVSGTIEFENDTALLRATVRVPMRFVCDRCATSFDKNLLAETEAEFCEIGEYEEPSEIEMEYKILSNRINLEPVVRDIVLEQIPSQVLCKDDCKGLCPVCGENLNFSSCRCKK